MPRQDLMLNTLLGGRYRIMTVLGAGGFGQTFLAEDTRQQRQCVVKQFKPISSDERFLAVARRLFEKEADTLSRLGQHDQIPELYDYFEEGEEFYLVQEFIDGHSLAEEFFQGQLLSEPAAVALLRDVLDVLTFVHEHQVIHRDIKPANLIRRRKDGKIVLIDFGAVKEFQTQLTASPGQTGFTVGIGTQGYTPSEQLMGKPRYCSDLYALGMTTIQGITGIQPTQMLTDATTSDIRWRDYAAISPGLAFILDRMVRFDYTQRYQSAPEVLRALQKLAELPTDLTDIPPALLLPEAMLQSQTEPMVWMDWRSRLRRGIQVVAIASIAVSGLVGGLRLLGWLDPLEMVAYDQMTRLQPQLPPDPRLLVVGVTEADLQRLQRVTPSDATLAQVLEKLQRMQPRVIGLGLYRDLPQPPGQADLLRQLQSPNVITLYRIGEGEADHIPPPPGVPATRTGFSDISLDPGNIVRRNFMFGSTPDGQPLESFAVKLAFRYLAGQNIQPQGSPANPTLLKLGETTFPPLESNSGAYQALDAGGYQIMLRYRSSHSPAQQVSLMDVLQDRVQPEWVRDRVVLVGTVAPSSKDLFYTPFSASADANHQMPGVVLYAQMTSQILSAVLDGDRLIWYLPQWGEGMWIAVWAIAGSSIFWFIRNPILLGLVGVGAVVVLAGSSLLLFSQQGWLPVVAPAIAFGVSGVVVAAYRTYQDHQQQRSLNTLLWQDTIPTQRF
ncbi:MAG TPA: CHASE2 domain-containing protein [Synechococcales cyanobacterium M55_K2018_004]|nr:CHASE2 domain-containing protein [Synechococcales cyanobacterium M55_K2018_004]